jgi:alkylated DNA repair dioxygenase AlkB
VVAEPSPDLIARYAVRDCDDVLYIPGFFGNAFDTAFDTSLADLGAAIAWREESITMFGRRVTVPRLCAWYGDVGVAYRYSHSTHRADGWLSELEVVRDQLLERLGIRFNFVLANLYRTGQDAMGWHADDEPELGARPCIASLSFGAPRRFRLRARDGRARRVDLMLEHGSLLLMWGRSQRDWQHALPRMRAASGPRINLTYRCVETLS